MLLLVGAGKLSPKGSQIEFVKPIKPLKATKPKKGKKTCKTS